MVSFHEVQEFFFAAGYIFNCYVIQIAFGAKVNSHNLFFNRQRAVLALFQNLGQTLTTVQLCFGSFIEVRSKLSKCCQLAELSQIQT